MWSKFTPFQCEHNTFSPRVGHEIRAEFFVSWPQELSDPETECDISVKRNTICLLNKIRQISGEKMI